MHAGLAPQWDVPLAERCAREFEQALRKDPEKLLDRLYGDQPDLWEDSLEGEHRLRFIANCFTRLRYVDANGRLALRAKGSPKKSQTQALIPWFDAQAARWHGPRMVFGTGRPWVFSATPGSPDSTPAACGVRH